MNAGAQVSMDGPPIRANRAAAVLHEALLQATSELAQGDSVWDLITSVLEQHGPHNPPVSGLFAALNGHPVCRGCDRAQHTATRAPSWPCQTYKSIAERLFQREAILARLNDESTTLLTVLDYYRPAAPQPRRHRSPSAVDIGGSTRAHPALRLAEKQTDHESRYPG